MSGAGLYVCVCEHVCVPLYGVVQCRGRCVCVSCNQAVAKEHHCAWVQGYPVCCACDEMFMANGPLKKMCLHVHWLLSVNEIRIICH